MTEDSVAVYETDRLSVRAVRRDSGDVCISGFDFSGGGDYEYHLTISKSDVPKLVASLGGVADNDALMFLGMRGAEIVRAGERTWLKNHGIPCEVFVFGSPGAAQPRIPKDSTKYFVHWDSDSAIVTAIFGCALWGMPDEPLFERTYRWTNDEWEPSTLRKAQPEDTEGDTITEVPAFKLEGWCTGTVPGPLPEPTLAQEAALAEAKASFKTAS